MIELFASDTPNGKKISIMLEEIKLPYKVIKVNLSEGEQFKEEFVKISPFSKIPVIKDNDNNKSVFGSGAIFGLDNDIQYNDIDLIYSDSLFVSTFMLMVESNWGKLEQVSNIGNYKSFVDSKRGIKSITRYKLHIGERSRDDSSEPALNRFLPESCKDGKVTVSFDLVEVSPEASPPVCKIIDYGKLKYREQKSKKEAKKKQKTIEVKEIKMRPGIDTHDYNVKVKALSKFIGGGNKVKVSMRFKGREMEHQNLGFDLLKKLTSEVEEYAKVEVAPKFEGKQIMMILVPQVAK